MLIVFAGGGTGGHLYPALAIADALRDRFPEVRFLFFGTQRPIDSRVIRAGACELIQQPLPELGRVPWRWPHFFIGFRQSSLLCSSYFEKDRPAVVIGTGGVASVPAVREAVRAGIPTALLNPDVLPGRANRYLAGASDLVFAQWEETVEHFHRLKTGSTLRVVVCGCPVRREFNQVSREAGLERFGLGTDRKTLLVTGASQGARTINRAVLANLTLLERKSDWQVVHLTGDRDYDEVRKAYSLSANRSIRASILPFTDHMAEALAAADLVIARAGASSLAEITVVGRASILMPYPYHKDKHQLANARCLERASAARIVHDKVDPIVNGPALRQVLEQLMADDDLRSALATAARGMGRRQAASQIADYIVALVEKRGTLRSLPPDVGWRGRVPPMYIGVEDESLKALR